MNTVKTYHSKIRAVYLLYFLLRANEYIRGHTKYMTNNIFDYYYCNYCPYGSGTEHGPCKYQIIILRSFKLGNSYCQKGTLKAFLQAEIEKLKINKIKK